MRAPVTFVDLGPAADAPNLAELAEGLGYARYWIGEHHSPLQCSNPLLLTALCAGVTSSIRVGTAGVCLPFYAPLAVAESAALLRSFYPGRIDLGICAGVGAEASASAALFDGRPDERRDFETKARELSGLLFEAPGAELRPPVPLPCASVVDAAELWVLGSGARSAQLAGELGAAFGFSQHHAAGRADAKAMIALYRSSFRPGRGLARPHAMLVVSGLVTGAAADATGLLGQVLVASEGGIGGAAPIPSLVGPAEGVAEEIVRRLGASGAEELGWIDLTFALPPSDESRERRRELLRALAQILCPAPALAEASELPREP
jgi:luciferase family oxidoreductase group 1